MLPFDRATSASNLPYVNVCVCAFVHPCILLVLCMYLNIWGLCVQAFLHVHVCAYGCLFSDNARILVLETLKGVGGGILKRIHLQPFNTAILAVQIERVS